MSSSTNWITLIMLPAQESKAFTDFKKLLQERNYLQITKYLCQLPNISPSDIAQLEMHKKALFNTIMVATLQIENNLGAILLKAALTSGNALYQFFATLAEPADIEIFKTRLKLLAQRERDFSKSSQIEKFPHLPRHYYSENELKENKEFADKLTKYEKRFASYQHSISAEEYIQDIVAHSAIMFPDNIGQKMPEQVRAYIGEHHLLRLMFSECITSRNTMRSSKDYIFSNFGNSHCATDWIYRFSNELMLFRVQEVDASDKVTEYFRARQITIDAISEYDGYHTFYFTAHWAVHCRQLSFFEDRQQRFNALQLIIQTFADLANTKRTLPLIYQELLLIAIRLNYSEFIAVLLNVAKEDGVTEVQIAELTQYALRQAVKYRRFEIFEQLVINSKLSTSQYESILFEIMRLKVGHIEFFKLLLESKFNNHLTQISAYYYLNNNEFIANAGTGLTLIEHACQEDHHVLAILQLLEAGSRLRTPDIEANSSKRIKILKLCSNETVMHLLKPQVEIIEVLENLRAFLVRPVTSLLSLGIFENDIKLSEKEKSLISILNHHMIKWSIWSATPFYERKKMVLNLITSLHNAIQQLNSKESEFAIKLKVYVNDLEQLVQLMPNSRAAALNLLENTARICNTSVVNNCASENTVNKTPTTSTFYPVLSFFSNIMDNLDGAPNPNHGLLTTRAPTLLSPAPTAPKPTAVVKVPPTTSSPIISSNIQKLTTLPNVPYIDPNEIDENDTDTEHRQKLLN